MLKTYLPTHTESLILSKICSMVRDHGTNLPSDRPLMVQFWTHDSFRLEWYFYGPNREISGDQMKIDLIAEAPKGGYISRFCLIHADWIYDWQLRDQYFDQDNNPTVPGLMYDTRGTVRYMNKASFDRDVLYFKMTISNDRD